MKNNKLKLIIIGILAIFLTGCSVESVADHNAKQESAIESRQDALANASDQTTVEPTGETQISPENSSIKSTDEKSETNVGSDKSETPTISNYAAESPGNQTESINKAVNSTVSSKKETPTQKDGKSASQKITQKTTVKKPTSQPVTTTQKHEDMIYVYVSVTCKSVLGNSNLNTSAKIPADGIIINKYGLALKPGSNAFTAIKYVCLDKNIDLDYEYTPMFGSYYISGIHHLYEKECGKGSGWLYSVNGKTFSMGSSQYILSDNDTVEFIYTCP